MDRTASFNSSPSIPEADPLPPRICVLPGVYRPQQDTRLIASVLAATSLSAGSRVLDFCTGSGALAMVAVRSGAAHVTAVDTSARAVAAAWINARLRGLPIRVRRGGLVAAAEAGPFDLVVSNPPYVPGPEGALSGPAGHSARWDAGRDGRAVLEPLCAAAAELLRPGGSLLVVHSHVCGVSRTLSRLRGGGLDAAVVARSRVPFGPVMRRRSAYLQTHGYCRPGQDWEELVVIRACKPA
ncbi:release factor glutamine methyltransferase [Rhodococcus tukisamuensis]|uniref:Release factor glutamine methyltransferase n=1 Tax=Rhodococcus tukisamuensis TaxID=168276 RepID=A0A1G6W1M8_9NOCA|nr:release factor glutamine methyltransferase [Rhodococcus tukisamuensis]